MLLARDHIIPSQPYPLPQEIATLPSPLQAIFYIVLAVASSGDSVADGHTLNYLNLVHAAALFGTPRLSLLC